MDRIKPRSIMTIVTVGGKLNKKIKGAKGVGRKK
jgi:hypothetical protein